MSAQSGNARLVVVMVIVLAATLAAYYFYIRGGARYTTETLRNERAELVKQDIHFTGRGANFAHYNVTAISEKGDTVVAQYRLPAAESKSKSVLWVYDEPRDLNLSESLDNVTQAQFAAVLALNVHGFFKRDARGEIDNTRSNVWDGMAKSKRSMDILLQFLKKHHVNDTTQIYLGGAGDATPLILAASASLPQRLGGLGVVSISTDVPTASAFGDFEFAASKSWTDQIHVGRLGLLIPEGDRGGSAPDLPKHVEQISFDASFGPKSELGAMVKWLVGADTLRATIAHDTTKIRSTTVTMR